MPRSPLITRRVRRSVCVLAAVAVVVAGCGDDVDDTAGRTTGPASTPAIATGTAAAPVPEPDLTEPDLTEPDLTEPDLTEPATTEPATTAAPTPSVEVSATLRDFTIEMPDQLPAGFVKLTATNAGAVEHHMMLLRLHDGLEFGDVLSAYATDPMVGQTMIDEAGGPNSIAPGATGSAELWLRPGKYLVFCVIPTPEGIPHAAMGMFAQVEVIDDGTLGAEIDWSAEPVDATMRLGEYDFTMSPGFDGTGRVLIENAGAQPHEVSFVHIGEGGSYDEFMSTLMAEPGTVDPAVAARYQGAGGVTTIATGGYAIVDLDLPPGDYAMVCYVFDVGDGMPHYMHGMVKPLTIPAP